MSALLIIGLKNAILVIPLALLAMVVGRWARRPALSHLLWTLVLVKLMTPPVVHVPVGWQLDVAGWLQTGSSTAPLVGAAADRTPSTQVARNVVRAPRTAAARKVAASSTGKPAMTAGTSLTGTWWSRFWAWKLPLLAGVWLLGSLYVLTNLICRSWQFHRFLQLVERRHESLGPRAAELALRARIAIAPRVVVVDTIVSPMLWGMGRRACLVFPAKLVSRLSPAELDALLLHELAHFARGDHWVRVLELISSVVYWWHPVFWWARHELEIAEEQCCDAWVIEHQSGARLSYAEALLATIDFLHEPSKSRPPIACGLGEVPFLRTRLTQIMRGQVAARMPYWVTALCVVCGLICSPLEPALWAKTSTSGSSLFGSARPPSTPPSEGLPGMATPAITAPGPQISFTTGVQSATVAPGSTVVIDKSSTSRLTRPLLSIRQPAAIWAVAHAPNGKYRVEARTGLRTTLYSTAPALDLTGHQIRCMSFAPDSRTFVTGHDDAIVRRWDSESGGVLTAYKGCDSAITAIHISPDGRRLAAGTQSGSVVVWDIESGDVLSSYDNRAAAVSCLRWAPAGDRLAISFGDWSARGSVQLVVWSPTDDVTLRDQSLAQAVGALDWVPSLDGLILAGWDGSARILSLGTGEIVTQFQIEKDLVSAAAWSPDCPLLNQPVDFVTLIGTNR